MPLLSKAKFRKIPGFVLVAFFYGLGLINSNADPDLWGYLAFGYLFWTQPGFPFYDPFSYMPTHELWVYHEWLTGAVFFPLYASFGDGALQVLRYGAAAGTVLFVFFAARNRGTGFVFAIIGVFIPVFAICAGYSPVRAQVFTYLFFAAIIYICEACRGRQGFTLMWVLPLIFLFWANLHGGFVAGLCILGLYALGEALSRKRFLPYVAAIGGSVLVTLINPYGLDYWGYLIKAISMPRPEVTEWMSLWRAHELGVKQLDLPLFLGMFPLCILVCLGPLRKDKAAILILAATTWMGFSHTRHMPLMGLAFAALAPSGLGAIWESVKEQSKAAKAMVLSALAIPLLFLCIANTMAAFNQLSIPERFKAPLSLETLPPRMVLPGQMAYPTDGVSFLKANGLSGNILTEFDWGQFVLWSLPESKVAMDGRYETVYPEDVCREFMAFSYGRRGSEEYLEKYPHQIALVRTSSAARAVISRAEEWELVYEGDGCVVYLRRKA